MRSLALALMLLPCAAQADDRDYLTAFLEDNLSGAGRQVIITGFEGALSSVAHLDEMTIADDLGVWLTLRDVRLDWNRTALFSGNLSVNELTAASIDFARLPQSEDSGVAPEATDFALPELPVSVRIDRVFAERITLGPGVFGQNVEGRLEAALSLEGGEGQAKVVLERLDDGPKGLIDLSAQYSNAAQKLSLDLSVVEGAGGLAATALNLPGTPSTSLIISGEGPFSDFSAKIALATDGTDRLAGTVRVTAETKTANAFEVDLVGDFSSLFLPEYAEFFGNHVALRAAGKSHADGRFDLSAFDLQAKALSLAGNLSLGADSAPLRFDLQGRLAMPDGSAVLLPLTTELPVRVQNADIALTFDKAKGDAWAGRATITGFDRADFQASQVSLTGSGRIATGKVGATLRFDAEGLQPKDAAIARALGSILSGDATLFWTRENGDLAIPKLRLRGEDYSTELKGVRIQGLSQGFDISGKVLAQFEDLSRFSDLVRRPLKGAANLQISGAAKPITGAFDLAIAADGIDMALGIPEVDNLLRGNAKLSASVLRDKSGTELRDFSVNAASLTANAKGKLQSKGNDLSGNFDFTDVSVLGKEFGGSLSGSATYTGTFVDGNAQIAAQGRNLRVGQKEADLLLRGDSRVSAEITIKDQQYQIKKAAIDNPQLTANAAGRLSSGVQSLDIAARLQNLALLLPEFPGPVTVTGTIAQSASGAKIDLAGKGPGGINATVSGQVEPDFARANLEIRGQAQAALANVFVEPRAVSGSLGFDLSLNGPVSLRSLTGNVTLANGRIADPSLPFALEQVSLRADLAAGQAKLQGNLPVSTGGAVAVSGTVSLTEPFSAALGLGVQSVVLRDPDLYETVVSGQLTLAGPLTGGAKIAGKLALGETELRVPSTGFGGGAGLPDLKHATEPAAVKVTLKRAGLLATEAAAASKPGANYALDVTISAPQRLFLRGRGLDAELGGELRILGSTADVQPAGAFNLIRGKLDILGKRFDLEEATVQLEGELLPFVRVLASSENDGIVSSILIEGPADDPKISFTSSPELPEEEVLAQLLFGQGLQNLSALQAVQLANAVATLAGKGGDGVISRLRQGFGLDDLDVKTSANGGTQVSAGKYITEKVYSKVTVDQSGNSQIDLNFDVTKSVTLRAGANSDGSTGVGVYLEKDY